MDLKHIVLIDGTAESQAPFFAQSPMFQSWVHTFQDVAKALEYIRRIALPYSIEVYLARNNIFDGDQSSAPDGTAYTLLKIFSDMQTIQCITVFAPTTENDLEAQIRTLIPDKRALRNVVTIDGLHMGMSLRGISYMEEQKTWYQIQNELHLIPNLNQNKADLLEYVKRMKNSQDKKLEAQIEQYSNKPGQQIS